MSEPYPHGLDVVWLASDGTGRVAAFITAGYGPVPVPCLEAGEVAIDQIEEMILALAPRTTAELLVDVPRPDDFVAIAERGLYVFDWQETHRPLSAEVQAYEPVAKPVEPLHIDDLSGTFRRQAGLVIFADLRFDEAQTVNPQAVSMCLFP